MRHIAYRESIGVLTGTKRGSLTVKMPNSIIEPRLGIAGGDG